MNKICAVIVTYNRAELLCRCVQHLFQQDHPLDIFIYDNHSTENTRNVLQEKGLLRDNVTYYYADENTGGSGGFHNGMKMAVKKGYEALWLMDDDGYAVRPDTLSAIVTKWERMGKQICLLNSLVICDEKTLKLTFSLDREYDGNKMIQRAENGLLENLVSPFNGTFVPAEMIQNIGYPIKEFFVYGDETEYTLRLLAAGYKEYTVVDSIYFHPARVVKMKKVFGFNIACGNEPLWKAYCGARNTMYYYKKYFGLATRIKKIIRIYLGCAVTDGNKRKSFFTTTEGIIDGLKGDLSKKPDFSR